MDRTHDLLLCNRVLVLPLICDCVLAFLQIEYLDFSSAFMT